jgi:hypothetical protein
MCLYFSAKEEHGHIGISTEEIKERRFTGSCGWLSVCGKVQDYAGKGGVVELNVEKLLL